MNLKDTGFKPRVPILHWEEPEMTLPGGLSVFGNVVFRKLAKDVYIAYYKD